MNARKQCSICFKHAEECPDYNRKSKHVIEKLLQLLDFINDGTRGFSLSPTAARLFAISGNAQCAHRPLKAIVFSQFRTIYEYFGDHLIRRFGVREFLYASHLFVPTMLNIFIHHLI
jgi:hypothetical protein